MAVRVFHMKISRCLPSSSHKMKCEFSKNNRIVFLKGDVETMPGIYRLLGGISVFSLFVTMALSAECYYGMGPSNFIVSGVVNAPYSTTDIVVPVGFADLSDNEMAIGCAELNSKSPNPFKAKNTSDATAPVAAHVDFKAIRCTLDRLEKSNVRLFSRRESTLRSHLDLLERLEDFELRFHIEDKSVRRLKVKIDQPALIPLGECLTDLLEKCGCEFAILPDGSILIKRKPTESRQNDITPQEKSLLPPQESKAPEKMHGGII